MEFENFKTWKATTEIVGSLILAPIRLQFALNLTNKTFKSFLSIEPLFPFGLGNITTFILVIADIQ